MSSAWSAPTSWDVVCRRSAGRRRYNAARKVLRDYRRVQILMRVAGTARPRGLQAHFARELGVSPGTISRDFQALPHLHPGALQALRRWLAKGGPTQASEAE
jgi:methylphosphotriester-DNA--protein-cysteine methyltransferase